MSTLGVSLRLPRPEPDYDSDAASEMKLAIETARNFVFVRLR